MRNTFVHVSMLSFCTFHGHILGQYDFRFCVYISFRRHSYYNDNLRCLLYLFSFGHVFFRASANCRLYQIADSTETPLLAQVSSLLSFSLSCTSAFSSLYRFTCMARLRYQRNVHHSCNSLILPSCHHVLYDLNVANMPSICKYFSTLM